MLDHRLSVLSILAGPDPNIYLLLGFEQEVVVDVLKVRSLEHLHCVVLKHWLHYHVLVDYPILLLLPLVIDSRLVESLYALVRVAQSPVQVE